MCTHACMWFPVRPCHLIHTVVHHHHPADGCALCERDQRPRQRYSERTSHILCGACFLDFGWHHICDLPACLHTDTHVKIKYMAGLTHAFMLLALKHVCTLFSPSLSSLTPCPLLIDKTSHPSSINFLSYH